MDRNSAAQGVNGKRSRWATAGADCIGQSRRADFPSFCDWCAGPRICGEILLSVRFKLRREVSQFT